MKKYTAYFTKNEWCLWAGSMVLILLWILAAREDLRYLSVIICFAMFLVNDLYGFINWKRMEKQQWNNP